MLFNSLAFAVFLPIVFFAYWALPTKYRSILLLIASYYFYMSWNVKYVVLILFTTIVSYLCGLGLEKYPKYKKAMIWIASISCLSVLFLFKYFNFFFDTLSRVCAKVSIPFSPITLKLMLPVGISFYTFQTLSYVYDVYKNEVKAEKNFFMYAAFISFFPQLVAGPIERTGNLLPQMKAEHTFHKEEAVWGLKLMAWGFFKKLVIADNLAVYADQIFDDVRYYQGFALILAAVFFTLQIYCDFSGYSDIAIGTARLFDIKLMKNFDSPYFSASVREFWQRWHISLSGWFRDYVYIPMGGSRKGKFRKFMNQFVTMLVSGLWHGAAFTYIAWGALHGVYQILEGLWPGKKKNSDSEKGAVIWIKRILVFILAMLAWVLFRAQSLSDAVYVYLHMLSGVSAVKTYFSEGIRILGLWDISGILTLVIPLILLWIYDYVALTRDPIQCISRIKPVYRWIIYYTFLFLVLMLASFNAQEFVYFQF